MVRNTGDSGGEQFKIECIHCHAKLKVREKSTGKNLSCPKCGGELLVEDPLVAQSDMADAVPGFFGDLPAVPGQISEQPVQVGHWAGGYHPPLHPHQAVQVNVSRDSPANSLGIASLVVGILSFFTCWLPIIGLAISTIGLLLGIAAGFAAISRQGRGIGFAIAGTSISGIGLFMGVAFTVALHGATNAVNSSSAEKGAVPIDRFGLPLDSDQDEDPETPIFHGVENALSLGNVNVKVLSARVEKIEIRDRYRKTVVSSDAAYFVVKLEIINASSTKIVHYDSWREPRSLLARNAARLSDNHGNSYARIRFSISDELAGGLDAKSIHPGESANDLLVFEKPVSAATELRLELPGSQVDQDGEYRFRIDVER